MIYHPYFLVGMDLVGSVQGISHQDIKHEEKQIIS